MTAADCPSGWLRLKKLMWFVSDRLVRGGAGLGLLRLVDGLAELHGDFHERVGLGLDVLGIGLGSLDGFARRLVGNRFALATTASATATATATTATGLFAFAMGLEESAPRRGWWQRTFGQ